MSGGIERTVPFAADFQNARGRARMRFFLLHIRLINCRLAQAEREIFTPGYTLSPLVEIVLQAKPASLLHL
jgi:hypothetical protein